VTAKLVKFVALAALMALPAGCGEFTREGRAPVVVVVDRLSGTDGSATLLSDVITKGSIFHDLAEVEMRLISKDPGAPGLPSTPSALNAVTINRYRVEYRRTDDRNVQGVDVPYTFDSAMTLTIPSDGSESAVFEIVRHSAKVDAPIGGLVGANNIISTIAQVTFYGRDQAGNEVSATASMGIDFGDFADK
jgi:hypothetical protein